MPIRRAIAILLLIFATSLSAGPVVAQEFIAKAASWDAVLDRVEQAITAGETDEQRIENLRTDLVRVRAAAGKAATQARATISETDRLLKPLGPAPAEGAPAESGAVAEARRTLNARMAEARSRLAQAELTLTRIRGIVAAITARQRRQVIDELLTQHPAPFLPETLRWAVPELANAVTDLIRSPVAWGKGLTGEVEFQEWRPALVVLLMLLFAWALRSPILRHCGPTDAIAEPSYGRRLVAAAAIALARGIVPAAMIIGAYAWFNRPGALVSGLFAEVLDHLLLNLLIFVIGMATIRAVLAPSRVEWGLTDLPADAVRALARWSMLLIAVFATERFLANSIASRGVSPELESFFVFVVTIPEVVLIACSLWPDRLWTERPAVSGGAVPVRVIAPMFRRLVVVLAVLALLSVVVGYATLSRFIVAGMIVSTVVVAPLALIRRFLREAIERLAGSDFAASKLDLKEETAGSAAFWLRGVADVLLLLAASGPLALIWQIPVDDLLDGLRRLMAGFTVGAITISPADVIVALIVFFAIMVVTRLSQRLLLDKVLPQTRMELGVQHSVATGVGYVGAVLAITFGVAAMGIDLTNLALVAGALSVGIGFGLQSIVNNFVSGLILLFERPIKVGDWIVVGGNEGLVKQISFRATEIETWQRASVIVPNGELLTTAVVNWTHADRRGRFEVAIGVAYGSDVEKVKEILLEVANEHPRVLADPAPWVLFMNFGGSSLDFELRGYTWDVMRRNGCASDLRFAIDKRFREENIEIPFPQHVVHMAPPAGDTADNEQ